MISQFCPTLSKDLLKREFLNTAVAFAVLAVLGFAAGMLFPDAAQQLLDRFAAQLEQLGLSSNVPQSQMMATLFFNNVTASLLAMLYGLIPFVPLSALALGTNALLLGAFAALYQHHGIGLGVYFIGILPHGIFELPALVLFCAAGLYLCSRVTARVRGDKEVRILRTLSEVSTLFLYVILPLLAAAALVETYVTPRLLSLVV